MCFTHHSDFFYILKLEAENENGRNYPRLNHLSINVR